MYDSWSRGASSSCTGFPEFFAGVSFGKPLQSPSLVLDKPRKYMNMWVIAVIGLEYCWKQCKTQIHHSMTLRKKPFENMGKTRNACNYNVFICLEEKKIAPFEPHWNCHLQILCILTRLNLYPHKTNVFGIILELACLSIDPCIPVCSCLYVCLCTNY